MESRFYEKQKRDKIDKCNICGSLSILTWDHVPPKFCFNTEKVRYNRIFNKDNKEAKLLTSQNGIKYRSICDNCNNNLLGSKYDKEYKKIVDLLYNLYINKGSIAQYIDVQNVKVNKLARAIVGHFLAAKNSYSNTKIDQQLREYFLDDKKLPPKSMSLLYYVYIYNTIMIIRDIIPQNFGKQKMPVPSGIMSCINSFPLAFILVDNPENKCNLFDLFDYCTTDIEEEVTIRINLLSYLYDDLKTPRDLFWPCNVNDSPTGTSMLVITNDSKDSVFSTIRDLKPKE